MSDDLVSRLRDAQYIAFDDCGDYDLANEAATALEAKDAEIERLRAALGTMDANHRQMAKTMADLARKHDTLRARVREVVGIYSHGGQLQTLESREAFRAAARQLNEDLK